ncbi:hypothetical protein WKK05_35265 [Nostoc sp. UHCC 0302]|uniref:hypothetical protein n=1 Tax=Nostoc sp. UHCC 0302 TaxID=3134896 RepID=UPI00311CCEF7
MRIVICPGIHDSRLTQSFMSECLAQVSDSLISQNPEDILIFPGKDFEAVSAFHILQFLRDRWGDKLESAVLFISFSAGVVGAIGAAYLWQLLGGYVKAFIAIDGWGVPLSGNFPIHRMSHDYFTHWSSSLLGSGQNNFYAEPAVEHLSMWRSPQIVQGCWVDSKFGIFPPKGHLTATEFLHMLLKRYEAN